MESQKGYVLRTLAAATDISEMVKSYEFKPIIGIELDKGALNHSDDVVSGLLIDVINENAESLQEILQAKLAARVASLQAEYDALIGPPPVVEPEPVSADPVSSAKVVSIKKAAKARRR